MSLAAAFTGAERARPPVGAGGRPARDWRRPRSPSSAAWPATYVLLASFIGLVAALSIWLSPPVSASVGGSFDAFNYDAAADFAQGPGGSPTDDGTRRVDFDRVETPAPSVGGHVYDAGRDLVAPRTTSGLADSVAPRINAQQQAGHVAGTPQYANRIKQGKPTSVFHTSEDADSLTRYAWEHGTPTANPNIRVFDFQRPIGTGFYGGNQTQVRVSINSRGEIHGSPWGPELP